MNAEGKNSPSARNPSLSSFYSYKNTFDANTIWCKIPQRRECAYGAGGNPVLILPLVHFFNTTNPYLDPEPSELFKGMDVNSTSQQPYFPQFYSTVEEFENRHDYTASPFQQRQARPSGGQQIQDQQSGLEALSAAALFYPPEANMIPRPAPHDSSHLDQSGDPTPPVQHDARQTTPPEGLTPSSKSLNFLLNPTAVIESPIDPSLLSPALDQVGSTNGATTSPEDAHEKRAEGEVESEQKVAHLLRHFSESPGRWEAG